MQTNADRKTRDRSQQRVLAVIVALVCGFGTLANAAESEIAPIFVDQMGYPAPAEKVALASSPVALPFTLLDAQTREPRFEGFLQLREAADPASGANLWAARFTPFSATGEFVIHVPSLGDSPRFIIGASPYADGARQAMKAFAYLRRAVEPSPHRVVEWEHRAEASSPAVSAASGTDPPAARNLEGGWMDGGDPGQYVPSGAYAAGVLLTLHELAPNRYGDGALSIPESDNGAPDILDEARWELEWLLRMQTAEGAVNHKLTPADMGAGAEKQDRFLFAPSTAATALTSAVLAKAARVYSPYDATFAAQCKTASLSAWRWLENNPNDEGFINPPEAATKAYTDPDDSDERFWAAIELYGLTHDRAWLGVIAALAQKRVPLLSASGYWGNVAPLAVASLLLQNDREELEGLGNEARRDLLSLADILSEESERDGFLLTLQEGEFVWGSNAAVLQNASILLMADYFHPQPAYREAALDQLHYILGRNPNSICYLTGFGQRSPMNPHRMKGLQGKSKTPLPGFLVAGPNQFLNDGALKSRFTSTSPPATAYLDSEESFSSNEFTLPWNAAFVFTATLLSE